MVEQIDNPANKGMHYGNTSVGVLNPPDKLPKIRLYSYKEGQKIYNEMDYDLYQKQQKSKPPQKQKLPTIIKIAAGIISVCSVAIFRKDIVKFAKGLFKRHPKI